MRSCRRRLPASAGLLQALDPRVRVIGLFALVLAVTLSRRLTVVLALFLVAVMIAVLSKVSIDFSPGASGSSSWSSPESSRCLRIFVTAGTPVVTLAGGSLRVTAQGVTTAALLIGACRDRSDLHHLADTVHSMDARPQNAALVSSSG